MAVPYTFGSATTSIPLSQLDSNFATTITLGNTAIQLGNTVTTLNNMTLANVTISSGTSNLAATAITNGTSNVTIAASGGNIAMATNGATAITVDTSQNVNFAGKLSFSYNTNYYNQDNAISNYASGNYLYVSGNGTSTGGLYLQGGGNQKQAIIVDGISTGGNIAFQTNATERARIDTSGNLLVGTTAAPSSSVAGVRICSPLAAYSAFSAGNNNGEYYQIGFLNGNGLIGRISTNGSATSYVTSSDYRLKNKIEPMTGALAKVAALKPCTYKWNADDSDGEGFIAHELAEVVPQCVSGEKDAVDEDGNPKYQGIDTSFLVATLTAALQETKALIDTQAETINALTARIVALEAK